jgi:preprotein translocase subunit SecD
MTSPHWKRFVWFCLCLTLSHPTRSAGGVTIPGYAPATGVERSYRVQKATETDMSFWFDKPGAPPVTARGAFRQAMTVLSRDEDGMGVRWSLSADLPEDIAGLADSYQMNLLYRNSLTAYGITALELETDLNGNPRGLSGVDQIVAHMREMAANGQGGNPAVGERGLYDIIAKLETNPLQIVAALVPEAQLLATGQSYQAETMEIGQASATSQDEDYGGVSVPVTSTWTLESIDATARTATLSLLEEADTAAFSQSQQAAIAKLMNGFAERAKNLTADQLASVKRASKSRNVELVVSLNDGSTLEASEIVTVEAGGTTLRTYTHIQREDMPANLQLAAVLTAKDLQTPDLHIEPLPSVKAGPGFLDELSTPPAPPTASQDTTVAADNDAAKAIAPVSLEVKSAEVTLSPVSYDHGLNIVLTPESAAKFRDFTQTVLGRQAQMLISDKVVMEAWMREPIMDGRIVLAGTDRKDLEALAEQLKVPGVKILVRLRP